MNQTDQLCPCGRPLHYLREESRRYVEAMIRRHGETVCVQVLGGPAVAVPRHFIALHGLIGSELPFLAKRYGWKACKQTPEMTA